MKFKNYRNHYNRSSRIYSEEDIWNMKVSDLFEYENDIMAQNNQVGIPESKELQASDNVIWIDSYTREDGTQVEGHWRSLPDGAHYGKNSINDDSVTGAAAKISKISSKPELNNNMNFWEKVQQNAYEKWASNIYPISSLFIQYAMHDLKNAENHFDVEILSNPKNLKSNIQKTLFSLGASIDSPVIIFDINSKVSNSFSNAKEIKNIIKNFDIIQEIKNGKYKDEGLQLNFNSKNPFNFSGFDLYSSIQHAKLLNPIIKDNYLEGTIVDYYDFKQRKNRVENIPNNWGYDQQKKGLIKNYGICIKIRTKLN